MLFLGIFTLYIRLFLNLALFCTLTTLQLDPSLLSPAILYTLGDNQDLENLPPPQPQKGRPYFSFIDRSHNTYNQNFNPQMHTRFSRGTNMAIGFCGLCLGGATLYYAKIQSDYAIQNTCEMTHQNDLEEVSQGLMMREDYQKKYHTDPKK